MTSETRPHHYRKDGRPEAYDVGTNARVMCDRCFEEKKFDTYSHGAIAMFASQSNPHRPGRPGFLCREHLPRDTVIVNPFRGGQCRDLDGNTWFENAHGEKTLG